MLAALLAGAVGYGLWRVFLGYPAPRTPLLCLARREAATVDAVAEAMFPPGGSIPASGLEANAPRYLDRLLDVSHPRIRLLVRLLFFLVEHATLFFPAPGRLGLRRFSALSFDQRVAVLDGWNHSRLFARRLVFTSLRALMTLAFFAHPPVARALRVAPYAIESPVREADLLYPRVGAPSSTIPYTAADLSPERALPPIAYDAPLHPAWAEGAS